jgi:hypothetical protein
MRFLSKGKGLSPASEVLFMTVHGKIERPAHENTAMNIQALWLFLQVVHDIRRSRNKRKSSRQQKHIAWKDCKSKSIDMSNFALVFLPRTAF